MRTPAAMQKARMAMMARCAPEKVPAGADADAFAAPGGAGVESVRALLASRAVKVGGGSTGPGGAYSPARAGGSGGAGATSAGGARHAPHPNPAHASTTCGRLPSGPP
jgi:hypothetical protein